MSNFNKAKSLQSLMVIILSGFILFGITGATYAQAPVRITGKAVDAATGQPLPGVNIIIEGTSQGTTSNAMGEFVINALPTQKLKASFLGYVGQIIDVGNKTSITISMAADTESIEEVVVVGYGVQQKVTLTGAVSAVTGEDIKTTKTQNVQNMLTGKLPGVRVVQRTSEPGNFDASFDIRGYGNPLVIIDGVPRDNMGILDPNEIESISVLKDASAAIYGVRAANGVVLITTKKGTKDKFNLEYQGYYGVQMPTGFPKPVSAVDRMILINEKTMHRFDNPARTYTDAQIEEYRNGTKREYDWYGHTIQDFAPQWQQNISASGSTDRVNYFFNLGYMYQEGFFKTGDNNFRRYNIRSNVEAKITKDLTASLQVGGIINQRDKQYQNTMEVFKSLWRTPPGEPFYANDNPEYDNAILGSIPGASVLSSSDKTGYKRHIGQTFTSNFTLDYNVPFVEGLSAKVMLGYDLTIDDDKEFQKEFTLYTYDPTTQVYKPTKNQSPNLLKRAYYRRPESMMQFSLNYKRTFAGAHNVTGLVLFEEFTREKDNFYAQRQLGLPMEYLIAGIADGQQGYIDPGSLWKTVNKGLVGRVNYDYNRKYIAEFSFRYDGSSKFQKGSQWGFFPGGSVGWRISEEKFFKNASALSFINNIKLRASYGEMGDENASQYEFISGYNYPYTPLNYKEYPGGSIFDGKFVSALGFKGLPNPDLTWYTVRTTNIGIDAEMWHGMLGFTFEIFQRNRDGLMNTLEAAIPETVGSTLARMNLESDRDRGFEISVSHRNRIGNDFSYSIDGNFSMTRRMWTDRVRTNYSNSWDYWRFCEEGRYTNIMFGHGDNGQFSSWDDIINSPVFVGKGTLPGDYRYEDYNGDGVIDGEDHHPICTNSTPQAFFGFTLGASYKGLDLTMLFQGAAMANVSYPEMFNEPLMWNGNALEQFLSRWHPSDPNADPFDPNTHWVSGRYAYTGTRVDQSSLWSAQSMNYLRLKTIELGYTLPEKWVSFVGIQKARVYLNAYNLFTISGMDHVDPEHPNSEYGYVYPLNKTINTGISVVF